MISDRLRRAIRLIELLNGASGLRLGQLAGWLGCSERTVYRDLQLLRDSGFEIVASPHGYLLDHHVELAPASLSGQELAALMSTINASPLMRCPSNRTLMHRALQKLAAACSPRTRARWLQQIRRAGNKPGSSTHERLMPTINDLAQALVHRRSVRLGLPHDPGHTCRCKEFLPEHISATANGWTVRGRDVASGRVLTLNLDRVQICGHRIDRLNTSKSSVPRPHLGIT